MKPTLFNLDVQTIENEDQTIAEVNIDGVIGFDWWAAEDEQNTKQKMREQLREIDGISADKIVVNISSLGGDVDHGLAIHDLLASNSATVETNVIGMTASAATIIAQAGDVRNMSDNALYLIHRAWTIGMGNANDFETLAKDLKKFDDRISNIYAKRSDKDQQSFMDLMNESSGDGIWISAAEAKDYGLIDNISEPMKAAAVDMSVFDKLGYPQPKGYDFFETTAADDEHRQSIVVNINGEDIIKSLENRNKQEETSNEDSVNATSRERAFIEIAKLKHKNNG